MNPQTQNRLVGLAIGAGTLAYLGVRKPWKKTESKTDEIPKSKLPSPDLGRNVRGMQEKDKSLGPSPVIQEQGRDQAGTTTTNETEKRN